MYIHIQPFTVTSVRNHHVTAPEVFKPSVVAHFCSTSPSYRRRRGGGCRGRRAAAHAGGARWGSRNPLGSDKRNARLNRLEGRRQSEGARTVTAAGVYASPLQ